jgi:hypothetical protein
MMKWKSHLSGEAESGVVAAALQDASEICLIKAKSRDTGPGEKRRRVALPAAVQDASEVIHTLTKALAMRIRALQKKQKTPSGLAGRGCDVPIKLELINQVEREQEVVVFVPIAIVAGGFTGTKEVLMLVMVPAEFRAANHVRPQIVLGR